MKITVAKTNACHKVIRVSQKVGNLLFEMTDCNPLRAVFEEKAVATQATLQPTAKYPLL